MESGNRCRRSFWCRLQTAHDVVRPGIGQKPAETADLAAQRPHRIADAAAEREFRQRRRRRRTGEADDHRKANAARIEFADPAENRRTFKTELRYDIDADFCQLPPVPPRFEYLEGIRGREIRVAFGMTGNADGQDAARLDQSAGANIEA